MQELACARRLPRRCSVVALMLVMLLGAGCGGGGGGTATTTYVYIAESGNSVSTSPNTIGIGEYTLNAGGSLSPSLSLVESSLFPITSGHPYSIAVDPNNAYLFVATWSPSGPGAITSLPIQSNGEISAGEPPTIVGNQPYPIAFAHGGQIAIVPNDSDNTVVTYSGVANGSPTPVGTAATGVTPCSVAVSASNRGVYVANYGGGTISEYALNGSGQLSTTGSIAAGENPYNITIDPAGNFLYSANRGSGNVTEYSIGQNGALSLIGTASSGSGSGSGANWIAVDRTGNFAYVTNEHDGTVSQFLVNRTTGMLTSNGPDVTVGGVGANPIQVAIAPDNQHVYVANAGASTVSAFSIGSGGLLSPVQTVMLPPNSAPWTIAFAQKPTIPSSASSPADR